MDYAPKQQKRTGGQDSADTGAVRAKSVCHFKPGTTDQAETLMRAIVHDEAGTWGDRERAMLRISDAYGLPYWTQFGLLYKRRQKAGRFVPRLRAIAMRVLIKSVRSDLERLTSLVEDHARKGQNDAADDLADLAVEAQDLLARLKGISE